LAWDKRNEYGIAARDFMGKRPICYARPAECFLAASTPVGVLAHPACPEDLNLVTVAETAMAALTGTNETGYAAVSVLLPGHTLQIGSGGLRPERHWHPPPLNPGGASSFEEGARELRELLEQAVTERLSPSGPTAVWLSGGWDSTALFGTAASLLPAHDIGSRLQAVSASFPEGDPGREDEFITQVVEQYGTRTTWLDVDEIPIFGPGIIADENRSAPFYHAFSGVNSKLASKSRDLGARVAFDGNGGDQLFALSDTYLADLFASFRWHQLRNEWREKGLQGSGAKQFLRSVVEPALPAWVVRMAGAVRGRPFGRLLEQPPPAWIRHDFVQRHSLLERQRANTPVRGRLSHAEFEARYFLLHPFSGLIAAITFETALRHGVELRSPMYDKRIVRFMAGRPRTDRVRGAANKRLLRAAMQDRLPSAVLADRPQKTGLAHVYFRRTLLGRHGTAIASLLSQPMVLSELGIVEPAALQAAWNRSLRRPDDKILFQLFLTVQTETWLRSRKGSLGNRRELAGPVA
jgi:asparagine synthase (glutamine-hydrolysing)